MFPLPNGFPDTPLSSTHVICSLAATYGAIKYIEARRSPVMYYSSSPRASANVIVRWLLNGPELLREGYDKYPNRVFKIAAISKWVIVFSGKQYIDDICRASDDVLSFTEAVEEELHTKYVLGPVDVHPHHGVTIRSNVNRNIVVKSHEITDEVEAALQHCIPATEDWVTFTAYSTFQHIICRTINRYFVGIPFCRDPGYCALMKKYAVEVMLSGKIIGCFPELLKPLVGSYITPVSRTVRQALQYLGPTVADRIARYEQYGKDDPDRPNDLISWFLETATEDYHRTPRDIVNRILLLNFAAIHTTSMALTQTLYDLAIRPEYLDELRKEAESAIQGHGWTKAAMQKLRKLDSFMKESVRMNPVGSLVLMRKTLKDWTTSDGTLIPAGNFIAVASSAVAQSKNNFEDADVFKGFRFAEMRNGEGELDSIKHQMVSLEYDHLLFGHGRHACPGRFFAVYEIKTILAQVLLQYDVQLENGSMHRPPNLLIGSTIMPNPKAKMRFRKRKMER